MRDYNNGTSNRVVSEATSQAEPLLVRRDHPSERSPPALSILPGETLVGWYENPAPWERDLIAFTERAFLLHRIDRNLRIAWESVAEYELPESKTNVTGVRVRTRDGFVFVRIAGAHGPEGKFKDAFGLAMVLNMLVSQRNRSSGSAEHE